MRAISNKQNSVVEVLQDAILSGTLTAGMELKQNELAESLEVSRMPIREALFILEYQGLVERLPNNHVRVAELSEGFYEDVFRMGEQEEKQILLLAELKSLPEEEMDFHRALYRYAGSALAERTLETITEIYIRYAVSEAGDQGKNGRQELLAEVRRNTEEKNKEALAETLHQYYRSLEAAFFSWKESK